VQPDGKTEQLAITLTNVGRTVAKYTGFVLHVEDTTIATIRNATQLNDIRHLNEGRFFFGYELPNAVLHPNGLGHFAGALDIVRTNIGERLKVTVTLYAEGMPTRNLALDLAHGQIEV
jgi:hypothetical protein